MLSYNDVYLAPLDKMKAAADDWSEMSTRLETLAKEAHSTMGDKAKDEYWRGINADVTKPFIDKTAKEFDDAAKAAKGIMQILNDGYAAFKKAKDDLRHLAETEAGSQDLIVGPHGKVRAVDPVENQPGAGLSPGYFASLKEQDAKIAAFQKRVDAIVETCDDADVSTANALKANITGDQHNFSGPKFTSLDAEEAQRAVDLAKKGRDLSHTELLQLNELLADNNKSVVFSRNFYDGVGGPKKALEFFGQLSGDTYPDGKLDKQRLKDVQALQKNMGLNLATATSVPKGDDGKWGQRWSDELRKLGTQHIPLTPNSMYNNTSPYGYQLLSGLLRYGNYDAKFLDPIAEHVVALHAKDPMMFADNKMLNGLVTNPYNPSGLNGAGYDPVNGVLEALGHSPEASKQFFMDSPQAYNEDGTVATGGLKDSDGKPVNSYLDFFADKDYESFNDSASTDPDVMKKYMNATTDSFGHALESATLGHAYDDPHATLVRSDDAATIMEQVVVKYGGDAGLLKSQEALSDSLGRMGAAYIDDIDWGLADRADGSSFEPPPGSHGHAEFEKVDARKFLSSLGQHPDAYADVSHAQSVYTSSVLEAQTGPHGLDAGAAREAVRIGAETQGVLDHSRVAQIAAEGAKEADDYSKAVDQRSGWVDLGVGAAVGVGAAFLPITAPAAGVAAVLVPLALDNGQGVVEQYASQITGGWLDASADHYSDEHDARLHEAETDVYIAGEVNSQAAMGAYVQRHGIDVNGTLGEDLVQAATLGYNTGNQRGGQQGNSPEVG
ncbi:hypothetical protein [Streptomyces sp. NBC_00370]|uniref:hypothetical protein n=1 Tax=Streptomyces sp. NBC_00370 TaxID=2975728 RepID=UPI002E25DFF9